MQTVIDNLLRHQLIEHDNKKDVELILTRQEETSKTAILSALMYVEMVKKVGRERMSGGIDSIVPYLNMSLTEEPTKQEQDSTNRNLIDYLTRMNSADLVTDSLSAEFKTNIEKNSYPNKMMLIYDLLQKATYSEYFNPENLNQQKKEYLTSKYIEDAISGWQKAGI